MFKKIFITGANGFLGSFYTKFLKNNYTIYAIDKEFDRIDRLKDKKNIIKIKCDLSKEKSLKNLISSIKNKKIIPYVLINNAAIDAVPNNKKFNIDKKNWDLEFNVSLFASTFLSLQIGEIMMKKKQGKIINIGSDLSVIAPNNSIYKSSFKNYTKPPSYSIIKHGVLGMTRYFAAFFAAHNISVNMISPGPIYNNNPRNLVKEINKIIPMGRMGNKEDLKSAIEFLIDDKTSFITGQNIIIDGGRTVI